jgi:ketosteroid isomerase-like protein
VAHPHVELLRAGYQAYADSDLTTLSALYGDDVVFHVSGHNPLSGDYDGKDAVFGYMLQVGEITGGNGGFEVESLFADEETAIAIVVGTAYFGDREFRRRIVHVNRFAGGQVREFWDVPFDQHAEDEFWTAATAK